MKIGTFSEKFGLTIDTIRYYIENGLLIPEKLHNQYRFDESCQKDLESILQLKAMRFSITEIKMMVSLIRMTHLLDQGDRDYYLGFFEKKRSELLEEQKELKHALEQVEEMLLSHEPAEKTPPRQPGLPLHALSLFACPQCKTPLVLEQATVESNRITNGVFHCHCGYEARIEDGLVVCPSALSGSLTQDGQPPSLGEYVQRTDTLFLTHVQRGLEWMVKRAQPNKMRNLTLLEFGCGFGFFMQHILSQLDESNTYIACEIQKEIVARAQQILFNMNPRANVIFMACDLNQLPLRESSMDWIFDPFSSTGIALRSGQWPPPLLEPFLKPAGNWVGCYSYLNNPSRFFKDSVKKNASFWDLPLLTERCKTFQKVESADLGLSENVGDLEAYFHPGAQVGHWAFWGKKGGVPSSF